MRKTNGASYNRCAVFVYGKAGGVNMKATSKKRRWLKIAAILMAAVVLVCAVGAIALITYSNKQNETIVVTPYTVSHPDIPAAFDGKKIVHLTDLHNKDHGEQLTELVIAADPDIIVITGDWIGKNDTDITPAKKQLDALVGIAPIYYVAGNHEAWAACQSELAAHLNACGVTVLQSDALLWEEDGEAVQIIGMFDPEFSKHLWRDMAPLVEEELYSIFLFHRPEYLEEAAGYGADLILCGHTHGGQIRLPLIGAVYAPNQGWFPQYDVGRFTCDDTTMILSQGLGESVYMRILTPPEMVVITLDAE